MILAKAPLRVSFFGGGSDVPAHYLKHFGATISMAIDKYVYVSVMHTPHNHIKASYSKLECVTDVNDLQNEIIRETLKYFGITSNLEITTFADIPTVGTGLAGSSAFTCALIRAIAGYRQINWMSDYEVAELACMIEIERCGWNIGKQDQYASAFGGMNFIQYGSLVGQSVVDKITVTRMNPKGIYNSCVLIPTNVQRHASTVLDTVDFGDKANHIKGLAELAYIQSKHHPHWVSYATSLKKAWELKKQMSTSISSTDIDVMHDMCIEAGASGCKLLGAGGGGYMLAMTNDVAAIKDKFPDRICLTFSIADEGAKVVYRD